MPQRVLIVDDDSDIREMVRSLLEEAGFSVEEAADGQEGLDAIRASTTPMVVLIDSRMPKLNGEEVLYDVQKDPALAARHTFVLLTATRQAEPKNLAARLRLRIVNKPFDIHELTALVSEIAGELPEA